MTMHNEQNYPRTMLERLQAAIENPPPRDDGDCFRCKCFGCKRTMQDGEPVWRIRARSPGISIMGWPKTKHSIEYFCKDCRSRDDAHSEVACAFGQTGDNVVRVIRMAIRWSFITMAVRCVTLIITFGDTGDN